MGIGSDEYRGFPKVKTIIYPNTVETIKSEGYAGMYYGGAYNYGIKNVILSKNLKKIDENAIYFILDSEANVWVPKTVTYFGNQIPDSSWHHYNSTSKGTIKFEGSKEDWYGPGYSDLECGGLSCGLSCGNTEHGVGYDVNRKIKVEFNCPAPTTLPTTE